MNDATKNNALVLDTAGEEIVNDINSIEQMTVSMVIKTEEDYAKAGELAKNVKKLQKRIEEYWEPLRVSAKKAYDEVLGRKKEMLDPLKAFEKTLKDKMGDYVIELDRKRLAQESAMRTLAKGEVEKKLEEAATAEANGDVIGYEYAMAEAEAMDGVAKSGAIQSQAPKTKGVSSSKTWRITSIDSKEVPVTFSGMELRPVDESLVMQLIKASKGTIVIPGVTYEETVKISVSTK